MALQKEQVNISFGSGLNTKTDPWQVPAGQFLSLVNSIFTTQGQLRKRNGYELVTTISGAATITTFSNNLISLSTNSLNLYSEDTGQNINAGYIQPMGLSVLPMVRRATSQTTVDTAIAPNGLACSAWLDSDGNSYYQINDSVTGGTIVPVVEITSATDVSATMPRVFVLGRYFIITYLATVSSTHTIRYIAVPTSNPLLPLAPVSIATTISSISGAYDGIVASGPNILYLAWNGSDGGGAVRVTSLSSTLVQGSVVSIASVTGNLITTAWDPTANQLWVSYYNSSANTIDTAAFNQALTNLLGDTAVVTSITLHNGLTSTASNGVVHVFYEVSNTYTYDSGLRTDYIAKNTCTLAGTAGTPATILRGVGLGSKATKLTSPNKSYMFAVYGSAYQPSYFLIDDSGNVIGKLAYENGGGYIINQILPQINVSTNANGQTVFQTGYLYKDFLASIASPVGPLGSQFGTNKAMGAANTVPIYTQSGIDLSTFTFNQPVSTAETGSILHMGAGFPWMFDGVKPVEHQFHVWPDAVEVSGVNTAGSLAAQQYYYQAIYYWIDGQGNPQQSAPSVPVSYTIDTAPTSFTGNRTSGSPTLTSVSSFTNLQTGQPISGTGIPANTYILSLNSGASTLTMSANASSGTSTSTTVTPTSLGSLNVYVPTYRMTYKNATNLVRIRIFRWSLTQMIFYEVTSIASPTLNNTTSDYITFVDSSSDAAIDGNSIIYTNGGVVEDVAAPSFSISAMFDDRLWIVDAEDPYTLWYSKQVIEGTGVEFSDLFTYYVAPTSGAQGSTGPTTALCPMDTELIVLKKDACYYVNGSGPDNTGANSTYSQPIYISSTVGCSNPNSIAQTDAGILFGSDKGIWLIGRNLQTSYIGWPVEKYNQYEITSATVIPGTTQVRFTLNNNMALMYDYLYDQWGTFTNISAISATLYQGLHTYLNQYGQVLQETPGEYLDISTPVLMSFATSWLSLAGLTGYQRFYGFNFLGNYISPHFLDVQIGYDFGSATQQSIIRPNNFTGLYGSDAVYGQTTPYGGNGSLEQYFISVARGDCQSFQISVQEVYNPFFGNLAGAGFTMSGINATVGLKRGRRPNKAINQV